MTVFPLAPVQRVERYRTAVANTLAWAEESAARGDYAEALAWLDVLEAIGDQLIGGYQIKRRAWNSPIGREPSIGRAR